MEIDILDSCCNLSMNRDEILIKNPRSKMQNFLDINDIDLAKMETDDLVMMRLASNIPADDCFTYEQILCGSWKNYMFSFPLQDQASRCVTQELYVRMADVLPSQSVHPPQESSNSKKRLCCSRCGTTKTSLWRRRNGETVCNACALYEKLHGAPRPPHLLNQEMRRRNRSPANKKRPDSHNQRS